MDSDPSEASDLQESVLSLNASVTDSARALRELTERSRVNRALIVITGIGLVLDLTLSGLFIYQHYEQVRVNTRIDCTDVQRQALTALANRDQDANRQFYQDAFAARDAKAVVAIKDKLFATWDKDRALRVQIVTANKPVTFTIAADGVTFAKSVTFTTRKC